MGYLANALGDANNLGFFATPTDLTNAYPVGAPGYFAVVGSTGTIWVWDPGTSTWVDSGAPGSDAFVYIAYASDDAGTDFTNTFDPTLDYIAIKSTSVAIPSPVAGDFVGLWKNYKGLHWMGTYGAGTSYKQGDAVAYLGTSYIYINATPGSGHTPADDTFWDILALKGTDGSGAGDVNGPASSVADNFASFSDTTGKNIKDSGKKASDFQAALGFTPENVANKQSDLTASATKYPTVDAVNTGLSTKQPTGSYEVTTNKATTFGTINDTLYPTVKAVNDAIVSAVAGLLDYRGAYNASTNLFPATGGSGVAGAILKGDFWVCSVAGTLGGTAVTAGDLIIALADTPAQTASNWDLVEHDLGYAPEDVANKKTTMTGNESSNTFYLTAKAIYDWAVGLFWTNSSTNSGTNKTLNSNTNYIDADATHQKVYLNLGRAGVVGDVVYVGAWNIANGCSEVSLARANSTTTLPVAGVLESAGADGTVQSMRVEGILTGVNTNAWSAGTRLYLSAATAGLLTSTRPTSPNFDQAVATVALQNATTGVLDVIRTAYVGTMAYEDTATYLAKAGGNMTGAINEAKGADIASATTTDIGAATGNYVEVTGTTTITGLGTVQAGTRRIVRFTGALILTYNATSLILPTSANITTVAGDTAIFISLGSGNWVCTSYQRKDGSALLGGGAAVIDIQTFTSDGTWTKPANAKMVKIIGVGAGAGGGAGGSYNGQTSGGGGGGGGAVVVKDFDASLLGSTESVVAGTGGSGGSGSSKTAGADGESSSFGTWLIAGGGEKGYFTTGVAGKGGGGAGVGTPIAASISTGAGTFAGLNGSGCSEYGGAGGGTGNSTGVGGAGGSSIFAAGAGGGGAGSSGTKTGGAGGTTKSFTAGGGGAGGTENNVGTAGSTATTLKSYAGSGGGGGGGGQTNGSNVGGAGGFPGGGGGGGGAGNIFADGGGANGGAGANGQVTVVTYF